MSSILHLIHNSSDDFPEEDSESEAVLESEIPESKPAKVIISDVKPEEERLKEAKAEKKKLMLKEIQVNREKFDIDEANILLKYPSYFRKMMDIQEDSEYDPFVILKKYVDSSKNNKVKVKYHQVNNKGRFFANGSVGLQPMPRQIRGTIAGNLYHDLDIVNAHPSILQQICSKNKIENTHLSDYIKNRETKLEEIIKSNPELDNDSAKTGIISILNGGDKFYNNEKNQTPWLKKFHEEIQVIHDKLCELNSELYEKRKALKDFNAKGSTVNVLICEAENELIQIMVKEFRERNLITEENNYVNCFDGIMIEKSKKLTKLVLDNVINNIHSKFKEVGWELFVKEKDFEALNTAVPANQPEETEFQKKKLKEIVKPKKKKEKTKTTKVEMLSKFDNSDYEFSDFYNDWNNHLFNSRIDVSEAIDKVYPCVLARVAIGEGVYVKKLLTDYTSIDMTKRLGINDFNLRYHELNPKGTAYVIKKIRLSEVIQENNIFNGLECKISDEINSTSKLFNVWRSYQATETDLTKLKDSTQKGLDLILDLIFKVWADSNQEYYNYILSWLSELICGNGPCGVALVIISEQGVGKSKLIELLNYVLGKYSIYNAIGVGDITQKFNAYMQGMRLIVVNELCSVKTEFMSNFDKMKSLITDTSITIEPKNIGSKYQIDNIANYILFSNNRDSIIIEDKDRRYAVFKASSFYKGNFAHFANIDKLCKNQKVGDALFTFLKNFHKSNEKVELRSIPQTQIKREMRNNSKCSIIQFLDDFDIIEYKDGRDCEDVAVDTDGSLRIQSSILFAKYRIFCDESNIKPKSSIKFKSTLNEQGIKSAKRSSMFFIFSNNNSFRHNTYESET